MAYVLLKTPLRHCLPRQPKFFNAVIKQILDYIRLEQFIFRFKNTKLSCFFLAAMEEFFPKKEEITFQILLILIL